MGKQCILGSQWLNLQIFIFNYIFKKKKNLHFSGCRDVSAVLITLIAAGFSSAEFFVGKTICINKSCPPPQHTILLSSFWEWYYISAKCICQDSFSNLSSRSIFVCHFGNFSEIGILKIELISRRNFIACAWVLSLSPVSIWHSEKVNQSARFVILLHLRAELNNTWSEILIEVVGGYTVFNLMPFNSIFLFSSDAVILKVGSE